MRKPSSVFYNILSTNECATFLTDWIKKQNEQSLSSDQTSEVSNDFLALSYNFEAIEIRQILGHRMKGGDNCVARLAAFTILHSPPWLKMVAGSFCDATQKKRERWIATFYLYRYILAKEGDKYYKVGLTLQPITRLTYYLWWLQCKMYNKYYTKRTGKRLWMNWTHHLLRIFFGYTFYSMLTTRKKQDEGVCILIGWYLPVNKSNMIGKEEPLNMTLQYQYDDATISHHCSSFTMNIDGFLHG